MLYDLPRRFFWVVEANCNRAVCPRIFQLVATVARKHDVNTQCARGLREAACLVTQLAGKNQ
jgi:hypothetical protein